MGIFGKKEEKKAEVKTDSTEAQPNVDASAPQGPTTDAPQEPPKPPEDPHEKNAVKMLITLYPDTGALKVNDVQNLNRQYAEQIVRRIHESYEQERLVNAIVVTLADVLTKKSKEKIIQVPGLR